jgi:hypothetical protein
MLILSRICPDVRSDTSFPVQSASSNHAWRAMRSCSVTPLIPLGMSIRICFAPLLSGSLVSSGTRLFASNVELLSWIRSRVRLRTHPYPAARRAAADLHIASSPRNRSSHCAAAAQLNLFCPSCSSSTGEIGRTPTWLHAFNVLAHLLCRTWSQRQKGIS